jgi:hypothetical protein
MVAMQALDVGELFRTGMGTPFRGWTADLSTPGMSTGGGRQAVERIVLTGPGSQTLVAGTVDFGSRRAELRPHARMREAYFERYGTALLISAAEYDAFLGRAGDFFKQRGFAVGVRAGERASAQASSPSGGGGGVAWILGIGAVVLVVALAAGAWWFLLRIPPDASAVPTAWPATAPMVAPTAWPATAPMVAPTAWPATAAGP